MAERVKKAEIYSRRDACATPVAEMKRKQDEQQTIYSSTFLNMKSES